VDVFTPAKRSIVMAGIRSKDTKPELVVRRLLSAMHVRYRLHVRSLPGRPDIVVYGSRTVFQIKGCFWHGHRCLGGRIPGTNRGYWRTKIEGNRRRDQRNERRLRDRGWSVITLWECRIRRGKPAQLSATLAGWLVRARSVAR
jgi:DNA mismatch endonuclease, patch repair protein